MIVVDAANVVGSRPDGWWKDRAGAAQRLVDDIVAAVSNEALEPPVIVVLEGQARQGVPTGRAGDGVEVVHASGEGDDAIVDVVRGVDVADELVVVTADRELSSRTSSIGAVVRGPRWLRERLDSADGDGDDT